MLLITNDSEPPSPTIADTSALDPFPDKSVTATETGFRYPDPKLKSDRNSVAVPPLTYE